MSSLKLWKRFLVDNGLESRLGRYTQYIFKNGSWSIFNERTSDGTEDGTFRYR